MRFGVALIAGRLALSVVPQFTGELLPHLIERDGSNVSSSPAPASELTLVSPGGSFPTARRSRGECPSQRGVNALRTERDGFIRSVRYGAAPYPKRDCLRTGGGADCRRR